jgi:hypothetical protein
MEVSPPVVLDAAVRISSSIWMASMAVLLSSVMGSGPSLADAAAGQQQ